MSVDQVTLCHRCVQSQNVSLSYTSSFVYGQAHEILVLIAYAQKPTLSAHTGVYIGARGLNFGLRRHPCLVLGLDHHSTSILYTCE